MATDFFSVSLEPGCLDLEGLEALTFYGYSFAASPVQLPGLHRLTSLTSLEVSCAGLHSLASCGLERLPRLQHLACAQLRRDRRATAGRVWPADMGTLKSTSKAAQPRPAPLLPSFAAARRHTADSAALLKASGSDFPVVPAGIVALSRLVTLELGRGGAHGAFPKKPEPLDASALGDLSSFAHLRTLSFARCEVKLSCAFPGAAGHGTLSKLLFDEACPAQECMVAVLQYMRKLKRRGAL